MLCSLEQTFDCEPLAKAKIYTGMQFHVTLFFFCNNLCFLFSFFLLVTDEDTVKRYFAKFEEKFFQTCEKELAKINTFYSGKLLICYY